jgi:hypothetical protein
MRISIQCHTFVLLKYLIKSNQLPSLFIAVIINNLKSSRNQIKEEKEKRRYKRAKKEALKAEKEADLEKKQEGLSDEEAVETEKMATAFRLRFVRKSLKSRFYADTHSVGYPLSLVSPLHPFSPFKPHPLFSSHPFIILQIKIHSPTDLFTFASNTPITSLPLLLTTLQTELHSPTDPLKPSIDRRTKTSLASLISDIYKLLFVNWLPSDLQSAVDSISER